MRLRDLDPSFLKLENENTFATTDTMEGADGISFQCPKCAAGKEVIQKGDKRAARGAHSVICWFYGRVPDTLDPKPGRWTPSGTSYDDLTFVPCPKPGPQDVSVLLTSGCGAHFIVKDGEVT